MAFEPTNLPLPEETAHETRAVLKKAASAHRYLAELKGVSASIPNEAILINTLTMQEAKDSSEIENIFTTFDELFKAGLEANALNPAAKDRRLLETYAHQGSFDYKTLLIYSKHLRGTMLD